LGKGIAGNVVSSPVERRLEDTFDNQSVNDNDFDGDSARKNAPLAADDRKHIRDRMAYETRRCLKEYALPQRGRAMPNRPGGGCRAIASWRSQRKKRLLAHRAGPNLNASKYFLVFGLG
jgi:hypothetical protein